MVDEAHKRTDRRAAAFVLVIWLLLLGIFVFGAWWLVFAGWFLEPYAESTGAGELSHRVHEVTFGALFTIALIGAALQLGRPKENIAAMWQVLATIGAIAAAALATSLGDWRALLLFGLALVAAALHPAGRLFWLPRLRPRTSMVVMAAALTIPMLAIFVREARKAASDAQGHQSHWAMMAVFAITLLVLALLGAFGLAGWRVPAWSVVGAVLIYVVVSWRFPFDASARPDERTIVLSLWAIAYGFLAYRRGRDPLRERRVGPVARPLGVVAWVMVGFLLFIGFGSFLAAHQARVPHLVPRAKLASPAYCSSCHTAGVGGATVRPHSLSYLFDSSNGSCTGCHAVNPSGISDAAGLTRESFGQSFGQSFGADTGFEPIADERLAALAEGLAGG